MPITLLNTTEPKQIPVQRRWSGLFDAAFSLAVENASRSHTGLLLVITETSQGADQIATEVEFFCGQQRPVLRFPDWETLPYDTFSPHEDIVSERLRTLYQLPSLNSGILIVPATTAMQRVAPRRFVAANTLLLTVGQTLDLNSLRKTFIDAGYHHVDTVYQHGEFAVRGSIVDLYPMGSHVPYRIELFDDEIEQLRSFDPESQRTLEKIDEISILPAKEFPFDKDAITRFRQAWRTHFDSNPKDSHIYSDVTSGISPAGVEYYLPFFHEQMETLLDYLPDNTLILCEEQIESAASTFSREIKTRYEERRHDLSRPLLKPSQLWLASDELFQQLNRFTRKTLIADETASSPDDLPCQSRPAPKLSVKHQAEDPLEAFKHFVSDHGGRVLVCAESAGRREALLELLQKSDVQPTLLSDWHSFSEGEDPLAITVAPLDRGALITQPSLAIISEAQLFGEQVLQRRRRSKLTDNADLVISNLAELSIDEPVVHLDHGVGHYRGLQTIKVDRQIDEFLTIEYADGAKLFVPISSLHLVSRYAGTENDSAPLHKLGSDRWRRAKRKAAEQIRDTAAELLDIHAQRAAKKGIPLSINEHDYNRFSAEFPFEETPDQMSAIAQTLKDLHASTPMDRLICGDVGFGKTEVAMRAAFVAANNGKQVAILVPTTLLAQQHYESFSDRFADWPITIDVLSRFRTKEQQSQILEKLEAGGLDIIIGTHKLILGKLKFKELGLLIVDEEHRFGVRQKEKIKALRADVNILNLTATPIPRTLNMAMSGMRDISIITSPPAKRLSIKTFIQRQENGIRKEAISRELLRGGQVYLLHNDVQSIARKTEEIRELIPEARVAFAHGQMRERELEHVMADFYHKRFNVLVCTTIIETGIDIPAANTIIIERADHFGLAQLHQLRGRVGRSHHQAYAYLLIPDEKSITADAVKRLEAIQNAQELGAGFTLASHDLEIRGAGELLGDNQSGHMLAIGFSLYAELLEQAVDSLKQGKEFDPELSLESGVEVNLHIPTLIPDDYLPDVHTRLVMYKRIASAIDADELKELQVEMIDRFGLLNDPIRNLFAVTAIKLRAQTLGIAKLDISETTAKLIFAEHTDIDAAQIVALIQQQPGKFKLENANQLRYYNTTENAAERVQAANYLLDLLGS